MSPFPKKLQQKLQDRATHNALRKLGEENTLVDFSSNDYLGFSQSETIFNNAHQYLLDQNILQNGATGSRLLSGSHTLYNEVETMLCEVHNSNAALVFNSGYDANIGLFSSVPQRNDIILYDELIHASIRDGISMSHAKAYKFKHNDLKDLESHLERSREVALQPDIYVVTESVFSMDGDSPDLVLLTQFCNDNKLRLIIDEAHAIGMFGDNGCGKIQEFKLEKDIFARIITFGKALGCHGAAVLGSADLTLYLVNFARSFIYTTGLPPHSLATIKMAYEQLIIQIKSEASPIKKLHQNIDFFKSEIERLQLDSYFVASNSAIHCCIISGNATVKNMALQLEQNGFDVKPILSPTVPKGQERLRFCLHSYNSSEEITKVLRLLVTVIL
jgi:8-amino-7-oxononanoate synthase